MNLPGPIKKLFDVTFIKFLFVAVINTCFGYFMYATCVFVLKNEYIAVVVANIIAIIFNFNTYGRLVFKSRDNSRLYKFFGVYLFTMCVQLLSLKGLATLGLTNPYIAGAILTLPISGMSFLLMRRFVFVHTPASEENDVEK